jgi:hypothetical protein
MAFALSLILLLALILLSGFVGLGLMARFLTGESEEDRAMRFDPFAPKPPRPLSQRFLDFFLRWRNGPRQLTYRRDARGRFRKRDR